jgi:fructokinase
MGLRTCYVCKVARAETGEFFVDSMNAAGGDLNKTAISVGGPEMSGTSGHCLVMITQDAERTMTTDLGVSSELGVDDVDFERLRASRYFYVEGYLSSSAASTDAAVACREAAEAGNVLVSVSLSDPSMVKFFREPLTRLLGNGVQQVFCNEEEALSWAGTDRLDVAIAELKDIAPELYVTLGAAGSIAVSGHGQQTAAGFPTKAVDTTGAGDIYAGACIAARCRGAAPLEAARFANFAAADLVAKYGARLQAESDYKRLVERFTH